MIYAKCCVLFRSLDPIEEYILVMLYLQPMVNMVPVGEELMPHRNFLNSVPVSEEEATADDSESASLPTTPIRKLSRNRGLVMQSVVEDSPDNGSQSGPTAILRGKRKLSQG